jgi:hypothetical protein
MRACQYSPAELPDDQYLIKLVGQMQLRDQRARQRNSSCKIKSITFERLHAAERFWEKPIRYLEKLLLDAVNEGKLRVTGGVYYLPTTIIPQVKK